MNLFCVFESRYSHFHIAANIKIFLILYKQKKHFPNIYSNYASIEITFKTLYDFV